MYAMCLSAKFLDTTSVLYHVIYDFIMKLWDSTVQILFLGYFIYETLVILYLNFIQNDVYVWAM